MTRQAPQGIMTNVGDQLEPRKKPEEAPEVIEGEAVEVERPQTETIDDREYQEFLEFKRFKQWQATHGGAQSTGNGGDSGNESARASATIPWWKKALGLLRYKAVRRVLYVLLALLLLNWAYSYYFGSSNTPEEDNPAQGQNDWLNSHPARAPTPSAAVSNLYSDLANPEPADGVCTEDLSPQGGQALARNIGVPTCQEAVTKIRSMITNPKTYPNQNFGGTALDPIPQQQPNATIHSCDVEVQGGPNLGDFQLSRDTTGAWLITDITPAGPC